MATATADLNTSRKVIAKLRKLADTKPETFSLVHIRNRKTATTAESNMYTLKTERGIVVTVHTNAKLVVWAPDFRSMLGV